MKTIYFSIIICCAFAINSIAQTNTTPAVLTIEGNLICSSCAIKKTQGAKAQCSIHGHQLTFVTQKVSDSNNNELKQYKEQVFTILLNDSSKDLVDEKNLGKKITIKGKIYDSDNMIEVETFNSTNL